MMKTTILALAFVSVGCVDEFEEELSETEHSLSAKRLAFVTGRGHLDLSPMPHQIYGVEDGRVGWYGGDPVTYYPGYTVYPAAFRTKATASTDDWQHGLVELKWSGTVPGVAGTDRDCRIRGPALITHGAATVKGDAFATSTTDASATVWANVLAYVDGAQKVKHHFEVLQLSTVMGSKTRTFDPPSNYPGERYDGYVYRFLAKAGARIDVTVSADFHAQTVSFESTVSIYEFGFPASTTADVVTIECQ